MGDEKFALDPAALTAFTATLATLPRDEIRKAKSLFIRNAIVDLQLAQSSGRAMMIVMGMMCIIPIFLIVFIPGFVAYKKGIAASKQKIHNAIDVWREIEQQFGAKAAASAADWEPQLLVMVMTSFRLTMYRERGRAGCGISDANSPLYPLRL